MSSFPQSFDFLQFRNCSDMEAVSLFYQHTLDMLDYFAENKEQIANAKRKDGKWTPLEIISHILYWDHLMLEKRLKPIAAKTPKLESLDDPAINEKSILIASKGLNHLLGDLDRSRKQMVNYLGNLSQEEWESHSIHPEWKRVDIYRILEEIVRHDYHHGKAIHQQISS